MFCTLLCSAITSNMSKEQHEKNLGNPSSHNGKYKNSLVKHAPHISIDESHNTSSRHLYVVVKKEWGHKGASTVAAAVGEKAHLATIETTLISEEIKSIV